MFVNFQKKFFIFPAIAIFCLFFASPVFAISLGQKQDFFVNSDYDWFTRQEISASLKAMDKNSYFYVDQQWWSALSSEKKDQVNTSINLLKNEFENTIYPVMTANFGFEYKPGIDNNNRISILIHPMLQGVNGYFNSGDEYSKLQVPNSNEREIIYLNAFLINDILAKSYLAHEFTHLITFNQKNKKQGIQEEVWLNEARAEFAPSLCGYDDDYENSYLKTKVEIFLRNPSDSLTEWRNMSADYGILSLFTQYLTEKYGKEILIDSLKSNKIGIESINLALAKNNYTQNFSEIFTDFTITILVNDCDLFLEQEDADLTQEEKEINKNAGRYCYKNKNLKNLRINPMINFLPIKGNSNLGVNQNTKNWSGNWFKFIGGKGALKIKFIGSPKELFKIPYVVKDSLGNLSLDFFVLNEFQRGEILIPNFGGKNVSAVIIPTIQTKKSKFLNPESSYSFFWSASTVVEQESISKFLEKPIIDMSKQELLNKIAEIKVVIEKLEHRYNEIEMAEKPDETDETDETDDKEEDKIENNFSCEKFENNLFYGLNNNAVKCLQQVLSAQGDDIYPEAIVSGWFGPLTKRAVIKFQEKYKQEILSPYNLENGTGFVGKTTRAKLNEIIENN
ncbi:MAG: peptidoglycan-binding domain-containing protein [Patescibacteria group bacterium]|nr:peptidoglycan-binding domain-containing protein [Patescibacteria group bacterium]